ncbi:MAG: hypothetical protein DRJ49_00080 [Thermoprotei archaeon]|nr:MAG: hypothetical protein DRN53_05885 [Thermoprotei archaeon]RLE90328.1 MAG: hypothetical protein DRJ49_00080 [Thermoprotei archaeon]
MDSGILVLAFSAGIVTCFSPCTLPMLPIYIAYLIRLRKGSEATILTVLKIGLVVSIGSAVLMISLGLITSVPLSSILEIFDYLRLLLVGILLLMGVIFFTPLDLTLHISIPSKVKSLQVFPLGYGLLYALASLPCAYPIFIMIVVVAATTQLFLPVILLYTLGFSLSIIMITFVTVKSTDLLMRLYNIPYVWLKRASGVLLITSAVLLLLPK